MAKSMTAYGRSVGSVNGKTVSVEIKSVNSRFLDLSVKLPRSYTFLEERVKAAVNDRITRGKVDVYISVDIVENTGALLTLDKAYTESYIKALRTLRDEFSLEDDISVMSVAQNKDIFIVTKNTEDVDTVWNEFSPFITEALDCFDSSRTAEGENLTRDLLLKKAAIQGLVHSIGERSKQCTNTFRDKFEMRIKKLIDDSGVVIDEQRILTECAIYADKIAIDEELVRLDSHFKAFDAIFDSALPAGRKLDFLLQEMNREINTIGSKCSDAEIAHSVVDVKCELEKIREQIQNLE